MTGGDNVWVSGEDEGLHEAPQKPGTSQQQGKTREAKPGGVTLHGSGHSVNCVIDFVFV